MLGHAKVPQPIQIVTLTAVTPTGSVIIGYETTDYVIKSRPTGVAGSETMPLFRYAYEGSPTANNYAVGNYVEQSGLRLSQNTTAWDFTIHFERHNQDVTIEIETWSGV